MTLFSLLEEGVQALSGAGIPDAEHDVKQLLLAAFRTDLVHYLLDRMRELPDSEAAAAEDYRGMLRRRQMRCPLQQILGVQEFMGLEFYVNEHVLSPRQDTETLVELVLEEQTDREASVLDLCTGTGCIAVSLAVRGGYRQVTATDLSAEALKTAGKNVEKNGCGEQVRLFEGDLFRALDALPEAERRFDIIVSNPPYIPTDVIGTLEPEVRDHEPRMALDGSADGLAVYRRIAAEAAEYLCPDGALYLEIGFDQGESVPALLADQGFREIRVTRDLAGHDRVVSARRPTQPR